MPELDLAKTSAENAAVPSGEASGEESSSTSGTSGIDVADKSPDPSPDTTADSSDQSCQKIHHDVKFLHDFETFLPTAANKERRSAMKKTKTKDKSVRFDVVREFRFARTQSFVTMPSYGGCSLGMGQFNTVLA